MMRRCAVQGWNATLVAAALSVAPLDAQDADATGWVIEVVAVDGPLPVSAVEEGLELAREQVGRCAEVPTRLRLTVRRGRVQRAVVEGASRATPVAPCVARALRAVRLPAAQRSTTVQLSIRPQGRLERDLAAIRTVQVGASHRPRDEEMLFAEMPAIGALAPAAGVGLRSGSGDVGLGSLATGTPHEGAGRARAPRVRVTIVDVRSEDPLDASIVARQLRRSLGQLRYCVESNLAADVEGVSDGVTVRFVITGEGRVGNARAEAPESGAASPISESARGCIAMAFRRVSYPRPAEGATVVASARVIVNVLAPAPPPTTPTTR